MGRSPVRIEAVSTIPSTITTEPDWRTWEPRHPSQAPHVIPEADLRGHLAAPCCWCEPTLDDTVWVHHSADRREEYERGERKAS